MKEEYEVGAGGLEKEEEKMKKEMEIEDVEEKEKKEERGKCLQSELFTSGCFSHLPMLKSWEFMQWK